MNKILDDFRIKKNNSLQHNPDDGLSLVLHRKQEVADLCRKDSEWENDLRAALRQRPEYIIVGEVRGRETLTLFQAMATGHTTYSALHDDSVSGDV